MSHPTVGLDDVVHQRFRLGVLAILSRGDRVEFGYLKQTLDLSAGNLSRHLTTLVNAKLISIEKGYQGNRPRTWVSVTRAGRRAYREEMVVLRSLLALADVSSDESDGALELDDNPGHGEPPEPLTTGTDTPTTRAHDASAAED